MAAAQPNQKQSKAINKPQHQHKLFDRFHATPDKH